MPKAGVRQSTSLTFGDETSSFTTVKCCYNEFNRSHHQRGGEIREGRPKLVVVSENIDDVQELITQDCHVRLNQAQALLPLAYIKILHDHLAVKKVCSCQIPYNLTKAQKDTRVNWSKQTLKKCNDGALKDLYRLVTMNYAYDSNDHMTTFLFVFTDRIYEFYKKNYRYW